MNWTGVIPAMTTAFNKNLSIDHKFMARHARWMVDAGCTGLVALGSLGEGATLTFEDKADILKNLVATVGDRVPIVAGVSALSTAEGIRIAKMAGELGCQGLMVLPPYVYASDWREMKAHVSAVMKAAPKLSCMLYNNPPAYKTDFTAAHIAELAAEHKNLHAVKESSADVRRIAAIRSLLGDRLALLCGVDDMIVEGAQAGAQGWIAGLVNAFPHESVVLFEGARKGMTPELFKLYAWFLPLLRLDVTIKFVQQIKLTQEMVGMGNARVRPPRLELVGEELAYTRSVIETAIAARPTV